MRAAAPFNRDAWKHRLLVAQGVLPADLILANGRVVDVFNETLIEADVAISRGVIVGVGRYTNGKVRVDCKGMVIAPSFIDAHVHTESSLLWITEFARAVVPHGTGAVITDPHEIANIAGLPGLEAMRAAAATVPMRIRFTVPSCVPASPKESPGAVFGPAEIAGMIQWPESLALGELMNFPGVLAADAGIADGLDAIGGMPIDGHAPELRDRQLQAYISAGPRSDHESTSADEAREKLRAGMMLYIREGSASQNLEALIPVVTDANAHRVCFCSDDRDAHLLLEEGHVNHILRKAIKLGMDPLRAIRLATWNAAHHWGFDDLGAVAPGFSANLVVLRDLTTMQVEMTLYEGQLVAESGKLTAKVPPLQDIPAVLRNSMVVAPLSIRDFRLDPADATRAVVAIPGEIATDLATDVIPVIVDGEAVADPSQDLLKLVCVERHHATGRVGVGYVKGFGLTKGALASSIAHDAHNIIAVGADDASLLAAIATIIDSEGGLAAVADGEVLAHMPLPIAGILTDLPLAEAAAQYEVAEAAARSLGSTLPSPFGLLAFMALSVIPKARVTDQGFVTIG